MTATPSDPAYFAYSTNYLIDTEQGVILDVDVTPAHRTADVESNRTIVDRLKAQFDISPGRLIGDTAYGTAPMRAWMVEENDIEPYVQVLDKTEGKADRSFVESVLPKNTAAQTTCRCALNDARSLSKGHGCSSLNWPEPADLIPVIYVR